MKVRILAKKACGCVNLPASKSIAQRALLAAALSEGESLIRNLPDCDDVRAMLSCLKTAGISIEFCEKTAKVQGKTIENWKTDGVFDVGESAGTLRFLIPILLSKGNPIRFSCRGRLADRPLNGYAEAFGLQVEKDENSLVLSGNPTPGTFTLAGNVSSQFVSGLLFSLPFLPGDSRIVLTETVESRPYIHLTRTVLSEFGLQSAWKNENELLVPGNQRGVAASFEIEGDASAACFYDALNLLGGNVTLCGLTEKSAQGDAVYPTLFEKLKREACEISLRDCPDLGPILFVLAALFHGATFTKTDRLRLKESDRVESMQTELAKCGVKMTIGEDFVTVAPGCHAPAEPLCGHHDHRVVMALAVFLTRFGGVLEDAEAVAKSNPQFFSDWLQLGLLSE